VCTDEMSSLYSFPETVACS